MSETSRVRSLYLSYLSRPAGERFVYRTIARRKVRRILEIGIALGQRATRMIEMARRYHPASEVCYVGIDPFEGRSSMDGPGVTLKMAHRLLHATGARVQLVPGDPLSALARTANSLGKVDLVVVSSRVDPGQLAGAWFYVPRMLEKDSAVLLESSLPGGQTAVRVADADEIASLSASAASRRAA